MSKLRYATSTLAACAFAGGMLWAGPTAAEEGAGVPPLDVKALALGDPELRALLVGNTIAQKGEWPFAFYFDPSGKFEGWYAEDKAGNEKGQDKVRDAGPWEVKNSQICITFKLEAGGVQIDCRYLVKIGAQVLVFDPKGALLYPNVSVDEGKAL